MHLHTKFESAGRLSNISPHQTTRNPPYVVLVRKGKDVYSVTVPEKSDLQFPCKKGLNLMLSSSTDSIMKLTTLLGQVTSGSSGAADELTRLLLPGLKIIIRRRLNTQDVDDVVHDTLVDVFAAVRDGVLRNPEALPVFARAIAVRKCAGCVNRLVAERSRIPQLTSDLEKAAAAHLDPETQALNSEKTALARAVLAELDERDQEILRRFYFHEQRPEQICLEMRLSPTQFRLTKSRAKARFAELARTKARRPITALISRLSNCA